MKQAEKLNKGQNISIGLSGIKVTEVKDYYVDENITAYKFFSYKCIAINVIYVLIVVFNAFMIIRLMKLQDKDNRLTKDDEILYDEEENVKF